MRLFLIPAFLFLAAAGEAPSFQIDHPWARASAGAAKNGAAYLTITDKGAADKLVGVSSPAADMVQLHETIDDKGVMKMRPVPALALQPGKPVTLAPGGYHIMLMGLKAPLTAGTTFPVTLTFEHAPPMTVTVAVEDARPAAGMDHMHH